MKQQTHDFYTQQIHTTCRFKIVYPHKQHLIRHFDGYLLLESETKYKLTNVNPN